MHITQAHFGPSIDINPSDLAEWDTCHRRLAYQQIWRVQVDAPDAETVFDSVIKSCVYRFLLEDALGQPKTDPIEHFQTLWAEAQTELSLRFPPHQCADSFKRAGVRLMRFLQSRWKLSRLQVARRTDGTPLVQRSMWMQLPCVEAGQGPTPSMSLSGTIGAVVHVSGGVYGLLEVASVRTPHLESYVRRCDALTGLQLLYEANASAYRDPPLSQVGFWDFWTGDSDSDINAPLWVPKRSADDAQEFVHKAYWLGQDVLTGRFSRCTRLQTNSPCSDCRFSGDCLDQDRTGLRFPNATPVQIAA